ncbi:MAG TPA: hypothetical protein VFU11_00295 [Solirubrobacterales bacterium]|nr:hypothetical protein [Solirubrobacterales bacterium]
MKQIRKRLTYANVMSSLALFLVLGGATAFAATKIGANQLKANSVKTGKIVKEAITTSKIKNGAVTTNKIADNAVTGAKADEGTFGQVPSAKTADVAGSASNVLWAVVSNPSGVSNATLVRSSQPAPAVIESTGVIVQFNRNISNCVWNATRGATGEGVETAGFVEVGGADGNPNAIDVRTRESDGSITDGNFHLVVICP